MKLYKYSDFLKLQTKVLIDGEDTDVKITTTDGIIDMHPKVKHLEIGNTNITEVSGLSRLKELDTLMLYDNKLLSSLDGLDIKCKTFLLSGTDVLKSLGNAKIETETLILRFCDNLKLDFSNIKAETVEIKKLGKIENVLFLKDSNTKKFIVSDQDIDSLDGVQRMPELTIDLHGNFSHEFFYHEMFYKKNKGAIKDYWKELLDYWFDTAKSDDKSGFQVMLDSNELSGFFKDINLPDPSNYKYFTQEERNIIKSIMGINKFKL